jgi:hypothetical protein
LEPSNSSREDRILLGLDRAAISGLGLGLAMYFVPFWSEGRLRWGFWLTLVSTLIHVYTSHRRSEAAPATAGRESA